MKNTTRIAAGIAAALCLGFLNAPARARRPHLLTWAGRVDSVTDVYFRQGRSWTKRVSGRRVPGAGEKSAATLPLRPVRLTLDQDLGRGNVALRQQPTKGNNYTAVVRVRDRKGGASRYRFTLRWSD